MSILEARLLPVEIRIIDPALELRYKDIVAQGIADDYQQDLANMLPSQSRARLR